MTGHRVKDAEDFKLRRLDVAALRAIPALPASWLISGLVYDVATGRAEVVVPAARAHSA